MPEDKTSLLACNVGPIATDKNLQVAGEILTFSAENPCRVTMLEFIEWTHGPLSTCNGPLVLPAHSFSSHLAFNEQSV